MIHSLLALILLFATATCAQVNSIQNALKNQKFGIQLIDDYKEHYRKTGDEKQLLPKLEEAERLLDDSYRVFMASSDFAQASLSLTKLADCKRLRSEFANSIQLYDQAYALAEKVRNVEIQALASIGKTRALLFGPQPDYAAALAQVDLVLPLSQTLKDQSIYFEHLELKSIILKNSDLSGAYEAIHRALSVATTKRDPKLLMYGYLQRGDVYYRMAQQCEYSHNFKFCLNMADSAQSDYQRAAELAVSLDYKGLLQPLRSLNTSIEALRITIKSKQRSDSTSAQFDIFSPETFNDVSVESSFLGGALPSSISQSDLMMVVDYFIKQFNILQAGDARSAYIRGLRNELNHENDEALREYLKATDLLESDRRRLKDGEMRGSLLEDKVDFYYRPIRHMLDKGRTTEAFQLLEKSKSRVLVDLLDTKNLVLRNPRARELHAAERNLRTQIGALQNELFRMLTKAGSDSQKSAATRTEIQRKDKEHQNLLAQIKREAPELLDIVTSEPIALPHLQQAMSGAYEIIEYLIMEPNVLIWHISSQGVTVKSVFLPRAEILRKVGALYTALTSPEKSFDQEPARELFLYLIRPIRDQIRAPHIVIIPHEELFYIPFQVLFDQDDQRYLGERYQISYAPSATVLFKMGKGKITGKLLAVADPSSNYFVSEAQAIAQLFAATDRKVVTDKFITEDTFKSLASQFNVIHLSVHGNYDIKDPMLSYLKLGVSNKEDGRLTAAEIFGLPLEQTNLITLSACETGRATATHANEILGISRALIYAGAKASVVSHWRVDAKSTALWMETFYQQGRIQSLAEAAQSALIKVKSQKEFSHPYYWAAFYLIGR